MKKSILQFIVVVGFCFFSLSLKAQEPAVKQNPKIDLSLSPEHNRNISPNYNPGINPKTNWNINPDYNKLINPEKNNKINPKLNASLNPFSNQLLNPMMYKTLNPKNSLWKGYYLYDERDNLIGFITKPMNDVLICFDLRGEWTCYYVLTPEGTYNHFEKSAEWTGNYICSDLNGGYNIFNKEGNWTGKHIK